MSQRIAKGFALRMLPPAHVAQVQLPSLKQQCATRRAPASTRGRRGRALPAQKRQSRIEIFGPLTKRLGGQRLAVRAKPYLLLLHDVVHRLGAEAHRTEVCPQVIVRPVTVRAPVVVAACARSPDSGR
eukprot:8230958-Pyramimonas_sp.AAC.1